MLEGKELGHYQILKKIGAGGMGEVYLARDTGLERLAALKLLPADFSNSDERVRRFVQEAKAASALNHPNILTIHEIGNADGARFIASEFIEGETLRERLENETLDLRETLDIAVQVAAALNAAHASGIIHRDIKPENIMIRRDDGLVKVLDFGLAKLLEPPAEPNVDTEAETYVQVKTSPGMIMGTVSYMSPEQARGKETDARTDIWSLGVVIYEMLAGQKPFAGETMSDSIAAILKSDPPPIKREIQEIPAELRRIVQKALQKEAGERYQTAKDLLSDLRALQKRLEFEAEFGVASGVFETVKTKTQYAEDETQTLQVAKTVGQISSIGETPNGKSIAVLPFANMSADAENEYFCDGLAEELLNALAKIDDLKVAARTSAFSFKGKNAEVSQIGKTLNVKTILEGSVRKSGNRLRITVQLINAADGYNLWSERYDREMQDIFDVQDEITLAVVDALKLKLFGEEKDSVLKHYTDNTEAYELYMRGRFFWNKFTFEGFQKSIEYFNQALALDSEYALAYAGLADAYGMLSEFVGLSPLEAMPKAKEAALKAVSLDDQLSDAHTSLAFILQDFDFDFTGAEREFELAVKLKPNNSTAHLFYGKLLAELVRHDEAAAEFRRALELDPLSVVGNWIYGFNLFKARRFDEAIAQTKKTLELDNNFPPAHLSLAFIYQVKGDYAETVEECAKYNELVGSPQNAVLIRECFALGGWLGFLRAMTGDSRPPDLPSYVTATLHAALDEKDKAFDELKKAYESRESYLAMLKVDPRLDSLRDDLRFQELLGKVGFPQ